MAKPSRRFVTPMQEALLSALISGLSLKHSISLKDGIVIHPTTFEDVFDFIEYKLCTKAYEQGQKRKNK